MVKTFKLNLSKKEDKIEHNGEVYNKREKELFLLEDLFKFARQNVKEMQKCLEISESIDSIRNLDENQDFLEFTRDEIKYIVDGFKHTTQAPEKDFWIENFRELFKQIVEASKK